MNRCTRVRALRSCSGDVHVARVVVSLVVHAVVGLTLGLIAHDVVVVFVVAFPWPFFLYLEVYSLHPPSVTVNCCCVRGICPHVHGCHVDDCAYFSMRLEPQSTVRQDMTTGRINQEVCL